MKGSRPGTAVVRSPAAARALARVWMALIIVLGSGAALLQWLGPPPAPMNQPAMARVATTARPPAAPTPAAPTPQATPQAAPQAGSPRPIPPQPSRPIAAPIPALLEPSPENPKALLPRIGPDGLAPMAAYAGSFNQADPRPRIGLVLAGIGLSTEESRKAIEGLPGAITLAFSPYAPDPSALLQLARSKGHEILISLPLEPEGYPLNDAGDESLLVGAPPGQNASRLDWVLSRVEGYVGATGAMDGLYGQRFAVAPDLFATLEHRLASRGLLYIDPRPGKPDPTLVSGRTVDVIVDQPPIEPTIKANLQKLETLARTHQSALGVIGWPSPQTVSLLTDWVATLGRAGFVLAPVTALIHHPTAPAKQ
ncbi:MAG: divergent polysaccharide deacetylase family protein [Acetobacteraceae bacterium]